MMQAAPARHTRVKPTPIPVSAPATDSFPRSDKSLALSQHMSEEQKCDLKIAQRKAQLLGIFDSFEGKTTKKNMFDFMEHDTMFGVVPIRNVESKIL